MSLLTMGCVIVICVGIPCAGRSDGSSRTDYSARYVCLLSTGLYSLALFLVEQTFTHLFLSLFFTSRSGMSCSLSFITNIITEPTVTTYERAEEGDEDDSDDDIVVGGATQDYKCPITLTLFADPVTSYVSHSFQLLLSSARVENLLMIPSFLCSLLSLFFVPYPISLTLLARFQIPH